VRNLAPHIKRQRLVFEGKRNAHIRSGEIVDYFLQLSDLLKMHTIGDVVTSLSPDEGWAGWIHWTTWRRVHGMGRAGWGSFLHR
jgi:hypothetical protein